MTGQLDEPVGPRDPLIGRGRAGGDESAAPATELPAPVVRAVPRPRLGRTGRIAAAATPARLRLALGVGLVVALAGGWFAVSSRAPTAGAGAPPTATRAAATTTAPQPRRPRPPRPAPAPAWVPRAIAATCRARQTAGHHIRLVVECAPGRGVATLRYRELTTAAALEAAYDGRRPAERGGTGPSRCALGNTDERAWSRPAAPNRRAGRYRCTRAGGIARIEWTDDATRVLAVATRADGDLRSLYAWWATVPGPVEGATAG